MYDIVMYLLTVVIAILYVVMFMTLVMDMTGLNIKHIFNPWFDYQKYYNILGSNKVVYNTDSGYKVKYYHGFDSVTYLEGRIMLQRIIMDTPLTKQDFTYVLYNKKNKCNILHFRRRYWIIKFRKWFDEYGHMDEVAVKRDKILDELV